MSLKTVDGKFQPAAAREIAKWIRFLHAKNISAKMCLCTCLNTGHLNSAIKDMPRPPRGLLDLWIPVVWRRCPWIVSLTVFLSSLVPSGFPHPDCCAMMLRLAPLNLTPPFTMRPCGSLAHPDPPGSVPCTLIHLEHSTGFSCALAPR